MFQLHPTTLRRFSQFKRIKRGYWSFWLMTFLVLFSLVLELFINNRALVVSYQGSLYFPTYTKINSGRPLEKTTSTKLTTATYKKNSKNNKMGIL